MANDSSDLINRAAQLRHNDLTVLGGNGDNVWGNHETTKIGDEDHDEEADSTGDCCGRRKPERRKRGDDRHHR